MGMNLERSASYRRFSFEASTESSPIMIVPGAVYSIFLDSDFSGSEIDIVALMPMTDRQFPGYGATYQPVTDPEGLFPIAVTAENVIILPTSLYALAAATIKFVSDETETCQGALLIRL